VVALRPRPAPSRAVPEKEDEPRAPRTIAIASGKGGVGKTSLAVGLAVALAHRGRKVLVVDADLGLANVDTILGLQPRTTLREVLHGTSVLTDVLIEGPHGIKIAPAASGYEEMARLGGAPVEVLVAALRELARRFDVTLVDTAAGISPAVLAFVLAADERLVVATPEPTALTDAYALIKVCATRYGERRFGVLLNMARTPREARDAFRLLARVCGHFLDLTPNDLGSLPWDPEMPEAVRRQRTVLDLAPGAPASHAIRRLAVELTAGEDGAERPALLRVPLEGGRR